MSRPRLPRPRITIGRLMAAIAVLAVVFALLRLPFGFLLAVPVSGAAGATVGCRRDPLGWGRFAGTIIGGAVMLAVGLYQRLTHEYLFLTPESTNVSDTVALLMVAVCQGIIFGTLGSIPVWLIADIRREEREREEARTAMAVEDGREAIEGIEPP